VKKRGRKLGKRRLEERQQQSRSKEVLLPQAPWKKLCRSVLQLFLFSLPFQLGPLIIGKETWPGGFVYDVGGSESKRRSSCEKTLEWI